MRNPLTHPQALALMTALVFLGPAICAAQEVEVTDKPAEYFFYRCAGCHTVGGGKLSGPDLITSAGWSKGDLNVAIRKMEKNVGPLTESDIEQMSDFIKDPAVATRITKQKQKMEAKLRAELPPPSYELGKKLFKGQVPLVNGGPACITCHRFNSAGGSLGPDLTLIKDRASGVVLQSAIENSAYKIMRPIYEKRKITKVESLHLSEYLSNPQKDIGASSFDFANMMLMVSAGLIAFYVSLIILNQRRKGPTRKNLLIKNRKR